METQLRGVSGWAMVALLVGGLVLGIAALVQAARMGSAPAVIGSVLFLAIVGLSFAGLTVINPNEAKVVTLFGVYKGSIKGAGFWWVNPLTTRRKLSLRIRNFESGHLKVNDRDGNPIEI